MAELLSELPGEEMQVLLPRGVAVGLSSKARLFSSDTLCDGKASVLALERLERTESSCCTDLDSMIP